MADDSKRAGKIADGGDGQDKKEANLLESYDVRAFNMNWKAFAQEVCKDDDEQFNLVIAELPPAPSRSFIRHGKLVQRRVIGEIDENEVNDLPEFLKRVLKTFGYCLHFLHLCLFKDWYEDFVQSDFEVIGYYTQILQQNCGVETTYFRFPTDND